jgi:hypothetical protein
MYLQKHKLDLKNANVARTGVFSSSRRARLDE